ncbi:hypothetical protein [Gloeothece verrucosa]|uniref:Uncharacterized protein n=1 Tax=Gloeothece verrucosa (strain PCC 7822) TaxID=497965 RepID=E0UNQ2_GLOV7|nr:hypothetical protein [Gloeothece verrucosa]ADN18582.1 hypothetical protein Cyan7822_6944 [Gloeothece verrucosa PCC 7822]
MKVQFFDNDRKAITETFNITIPLMPNQHYWQDGQDWEEDYPGSNKYLVLCSPCGDPISSIKKDASQQEAEEFIAKDEENVKYLKVQSSTQIYGNYPPLEDNMPF